MSGPRVLLVAESLRSAGGVERFVCELGNALSRRGMSVVLGTADTPRDRVVYPLDPRVRVVAGGASSVPSTGSVSGWRRGLVIAAARLHVALALRRVARDAPADVVVVNGVVAACTWLAVAPGRAAATICCDHNHYAARSGIWQRLRARFYRGAAAVVSLTEADRARFEAVNAHVSVIANASSLRADAPARPEGEHVLAVGRHVAQKGFDRLIGAWPAVVAARPAARLRILGEGPLRDAAAAQAVALGVGASVELAPPTANVVEAYRAAAVFVLPSRYEGMPLALLEAQALGVPAVAFDCPTGPAEVVTPETGIVVADGDGAALANAIVALLADPERRQRMGEAAIARAKAVFSPETQEAAWSALIERVAARGEVAVREATA